MNKGLTSPAAYLFRLGSGTVPDSAVVTIDPLATAKPTENDPAFGPQAVGSRCETCSQDVYHCPGHLGSIKTYPVPVPLAADRLIQWASFICHLCGRIGVSMEERESIRQKRGAFVIKDVQQLLKVKQLSLPLSQIKVLQESIQGVSSDRLQNGTRLRLFHSGALLRRLPQSSGRKFHNEERLHLVADSR